MLALSLERLITSVISVVVNGAKAILLNMFSISIVSEKYHWQDHKVVGFSALRLSVLCGR